MSRTIDVGKIGFTPQGLWNSQRNYTKLDVVRYNNSSYLAVTDTVSAGIAPDSDNGGQYWQAISENINLKLVNKNFLINAFFDGGGSQQSAERFPINTRGLVAYENKSNNFMPCIDCWEMSAGKIDIQQNLGVTFQNLEEEYPQNLNYVDLLQRLDSSYLMVDKTYTATVLCNDNSVYTGTNFLSSDVTNNGRYTTFVYNNEFELITEYNVQNAMIYFFLRIKTQNKKVKAVKFELGETQTLYELDNGTPKLIDIPSYSEQKYKCAASKVRSDTNFINEYKTQVQLTEQLRMSNILTVGATGCNFTTINAAVEHAKLIIQQTSQRVAIYIAPGIYNEEIRLAPNPGISLIGYGATIQYASTYGTTGAAPLYTIGGDGVYFVGLTFYQTNPNGQSYACHIEKQTNPTASDGNTYFIDCVFNSTGNAALGMGLGESIYCRFYNCLFISLQNVALYFHNYPMGIPSGSYCGAFFTNCTFETSASATDIWFEDAARMRGYNNTCQTLISFINCKGTHGIVKVITYSDSNNNNPIIFTNFKEAAANDENILLQNSSIGNDTFPGLDYNLGVVTYVVQGQMIDNKLALNLPNIGRYSLKEYLSIYPSSDPSDWTITKYPQNDSSATSLIFQYTGQSSNAAQLIVKLIPD